MIENYINEISKLLEKIKEEDKENIETIITYETSTEQNVGSTLCRYGELYKLVFYTKSYDEVIQKLEKLYYNDKFDCYGEEIGKIQKIFIEGLKKGREFELGTKLDVLTTLEHEYIFDTILKCL